MKAEYEMNHRINKLSVLAMAPATGKPNTPNPLVFKNCRLPTKFRM